jgi:hypothetical protein
MVTPGDVAVAVLLPVPVAVIVQLVPAATGVVNVALHAPADALNAETVDDPLQPPPHDALARLEGAATV